MARIYDPKGGFFGPVFFENENGAKGWVDMFFFFFLACLHEEGKGSISQRYNQADFGVICRF